MSSFSSFKNNFSSGVSFLRRRLSASDLNDDMADDFQKVNQQSQQSQQQQSHQHQGQGQGQGVPGVPGGSRRGPSAPTSPSTVDSLSSFAKDLAPSKATVDSISSFAKGLLQTATGGGSSTTSPAHSGQQRSPTAGGRDRYKILLVIDNDHTDWSKYFRGKKIFGDWDIRVEQAEFADINLTSHTDGGCIVDIHAASRGGGSKVVRSFQPDFVLVRQRTRDADLNWKNIIVGLYYGGVPGVNSLTSLYNFLDKPWVFGQLIQTQKRLGKELLPLIEQSYYPNHKEMICAPTGSTVVKIGHAHSGRGKVKADNPVDFQDVASLVAMTGYYATSEPFVDSRCDIHIEKIGDFYKAFARKSMTGNWKASTGSSTIEQVPMTDRYKLWADECSKMFGGLDLCSVEVIQAANGQEYIIEVNDSTMALLGESQDEDKRLIAEHVLQKMEHQCKPVSNIRKTSGSGLTGSGLSIHQHAVPPSSETTPTPDSNPFARGQQRPTAAPPAGTGSTAAGIPPASSSSTSYSYSTSSGGSSAYQHPAGAGTYQSATGTSSYHQSTASSSMTYQTASSAHYQQQQPMSYSTAGIQPAPITAPTNPFSSAAQQAPPPKPPAPQRQPSLTSSSGPVSGSKPAPPTAPPQQQGSMGSRPVGQRPPMPIPSASETLAEQASRQGQGQGQAHADGSRPSGSQPQRPPGRPGMPPSHRSVDSAGMAENADEGSDTMKNLRKTFAGIFSDM